MRTWIVAGSLLIMMLSACAPVGSATLHDVVLIDEEGAQRLRYAYGTADTLDLDEATYTLGDLVARRVAGNVDEMIVLGDHLHPGAHQIVVQIVDHPLVARDDLRREDHRVAAVEADARMVAGGGSSRA